MLRLSEQLSSNMALCSLQHVRPRSADFKFHVIHFKGLVALGGFAHSPDKTSRSVLRKQLQLGKICKHQAVFGVKVTSGLFLLRDQVSGLTAWEVAGLRGCLLVQTESCNP